MLEKKFNFGETNIDPISSIRDDIRKHMINEANKKETFEEWIWVEGYKGTDKNMCCRGQQYEFGKQVDLPEDEEVEECKVGYHLCLKLEDVFSYYAIGDGHRFFKVRALVRKSDIEKYGTKVQHSTFPWQIVVNDKLAAKSIEFVRECTINEIFENVEWAEDYTEEEKRIAIEFGSGRVSKARRQAALEKAGYTTAFAAYVSTGKGWTERALALASIPGLSTDVKVLSIFVDEN